MPICAVWTFPDFRHRDRFDHGRPGRTLALFRAVGGDAGARVAGCAATGAFTVDAIGALGLAAVLLIGVS